MRKAFLLAAGLIGAAAVVGGMMGVRTSDMTSVRAERVYEAGGLRLIVNSVQWKSLEHGSELGYSVPSRVMPVAEERRYRVSLVVTIQNPGDPARPVGSREFGLRDAGGVSRPATEDTLPATNLGPRQNVSFTLAFDVPEAASGLRLVWSRDGREVRIPLGENPSGQQRSLPDRFQRGRDEHGRDKVTSPDMPLRRDDPGGD